MREKLSKREKEELMDIYDNLSSVPDAVDKEIRNKSYIARTILQLPKNIKEKVLDEVIFVHTEIDGAAHRIFIRKDIEDEKELEEINKYKCVFMEQPLIILNLRGVKDSEKMNIIAHEIAHFILRHDKPTNIGTWEEDERAADDLAEKWGFKRSYKDYKLGQRKK